MVRKLFDDSIHRSEMNAMNWYYYVWMCNDDDDPTADRAITILVPYSGVSVDRDGSRDGLRTSQMADAQEYFLL